MPDIRLVRIVPEGTEAPPDKSRDAWATPKAKYIEMCEKWGVAPAIDVCAEAHNTKCPLFITPQMDSLVTDWLQFAKDKGVSPVFWMNPPYSLAAKFTKRAKDISDRGGTVLGLLHVSTGAGWFQKYVKPLPKTRRGDYDFPPGRIKFEPPPGIKQSTPMIDNLEILWLPPGEEQP